jgi:hypothetical protein
VESRSRGPAEPRRSSLNKKMPLRTVFTAIVHVFLVVWIGIIGSSLGFLLSLAGFVPIREMGVWSTGMTYIYMPFSGILFAIGLVCLLVEAENVNNQLALNGSEFGFRVLKLWRCQNLFMAMVCMGVVLLAAGSLRSTLKGLKKIDSQHPVSLSPKQDVPKRSAGFCPPIVDKEP